MWRIPSDHSSIKSCTHTHLHTQTCAHASPRGVTRFHHEYGCVGRMQINPGRLQRDRQTDRRADRQSAAQQRGGRKTRTKDQSGLKQHRCLYLQLCHNPCLSVCHNKYHCNICASDIIGAYDTVRMFVCVFICFIHDNNPSERYVHKLLGHPHSASGFPVIYARRAETTRKTNVTANDSFSCVFANICSCSSEKRIFSSVSGVQTP